MSIMLPEVTLPLYSVVDSMAVVQTSVVGKDFSTT
jgi:hypothetical protein